MLLSDTGSRLAAAYPAVISLNRAIWQSPWLMRKVASNLSTRSAQKSRKITAPAIEMINRTVSNGCPRYNQLP